jgi:hypothetical protein
MFKGKIYVPYGQELKNLLLIQMHKVPYARHPGYQKKIATIRKQYYRPGMKKELSYFIARCPKCRKFKTKHKHLASFLQPFPIIEWKWEVVTMDIITKLPRTSKQHDSIKVVVDKLTKDAHFIPVMLTHKETKIVDIYLKELDILHGIPKAIMYGRDPKFTSKFWKGLSKGLGTHLNFNTTYHPNSYGKKKRFN